MIRGCSGLRERVSRYETAFLGFFGGVGLDLASPSTYFAEQLESADVGTYHHRVIFEPEAILPDVGRP